MELQTVLRGLRRRWLSMLLIGVIAAVATGWIVRQKPGVYEATAQGIAVVSDPAQRPPYAFSTGSLYIVNRMTSYAQLGVTTPVLEPVVRDLHLPETATSLTSHIYSWSPVGKSVINVTVYYNDPKLAAAIADETLVQLGGAVSSVEGGNVEIQPAGPAIVPTSISKSNGLREAVIAGIAGVILAGLLAVGLEYLSDRVKYLTRRRAEASASAPGDG
jgi:capsular polysaccharide biosynthesis protein